MLKNQASEFRELTGNLRRQMESLNAGVKVLRSCLKKDRFIPDEVAEDVLAKLSALRNTQAVLRGKYAEWNLGELEGSIERAEALVEEVFDRKQKLTEAKDILDFCKGLHSEDPTLEGPLSSLQEEMKVFSFENMDLSTLVEKVSRFALLKDAYEEKDPAKKFSMVRNLMPYFDEGLVLALSMGLLSHESDGLVEKKEPHFVLDPEGESVQNGHPDRVGRVKTAFLEEEESASGEELSFADGRKGDEIKGSLAEVEKAGEEAHIEGAPLEKGKEEAFADKEQAEPGHARCDEEGGSPSISRAYSMDETSFKESVEEPHFVLDPEGEHFQEGASASKAAEISFADKEEEIEAEEQGEAAVEKNEEGFKEEIDSLREEKNLPGETEEGTEKGEASEESIEEEEIEEYEFEEDEEDEEDEDEDPEQRELRKRAKKILAIIQKKAEPIPTFEGGEECYEKVACSPKDAIFAVKAFRKDVLKNDLLFILNVVHDMGVITVDLFERILHGENYFTDIEEKLNKAVSKGYLLCYHMEGFDNIYTLSPKGEKSFANKNAMRSVISKPLSKGMGFPAVCSKADLLVRYLFIGPGVFFHMYLVKNPKGDNKLDIPLVNLADNGFFGLIKKNKDFVYFAGAASTETQGYTDFLLEMKKGCENIPTLLVYGVNEEHAKTLARAIAFTMDIEEEDIWYNYFDTSDYYCLADDSLLTAEIVDELFFDDDPDGPDDPDDSSKEDDESEEDDGGEEEEAPLPFEDAAPKEQEASDEKEPSDAAEVAKEGEQSRNPKQKGRDHHAQLGEGHLGKGPSGENHPAQERSLSGPASTGEKESPSGGEKQGENTSPTDEPGPKAPILPPIPVPAPETKKVMDGEKLKALYLEMLVKGKPYCATAALCAASRMEERYKESYLQLAYALDDPMASCDYGAEKVIGIYYGGDSQADYFATAAALRTFFSDQYHYDHFLQQLHSMISRSPVVESFSALGNLLFDLFRFKNGYHRGMDCYAQYRQKEKYRLEETISLISRDARDHYESLYLTYKSDKSSNKRYMEMRKILFSQDGDLGLYLKAVAEDNRSVLDQMEAFLQDQYVRDGAVVESASLDAAKLDKVIDDAWDGTSKKGMVSFIGDLRSRTLNQLKKVVTILTDYCYTCRAMFSSSGKGEASLAFAQMRQGVVDSLKECLGHFGISALQGTMEERAGKKVLILTLQEILDKMEGTYVEGSHRFFYLDFLKSEEVLLGEDFYPILEEVGDLPELGILERIRRHDEAQPMTLTERFESIVRGQDDYGEAMLIASYYEQMGGPVPEMIKNHSLKEEAIGYPLVSIRGRCQEFKEDIKLAQSNGLFDVAGVERMESILQNMEIWYERAEETMNYGFFRKILKAYGKQIREESKTRSIELLESLHTYIDSHPSQVGSEVLKEIQRRIDDQNYVAAEDLMNRLLTGDLEEEVLQDGEDYLEQFLDEEEYSQNIRKTGAAGTRLSALLGPSGLRNKDTKGGQRIVENWITNAMGEEKVRLLLGSLGFRVDTVEKAAPIGGNVDNYLVTLQRPINGRRQNYKHPIAAFGSEAEEKCFRVVCLFGRMDAGRLIDTFKEIGNAKHTLVFLDYALTLPDRRELARRTKTELAGKIFAVVDRVVIAFLVRHYTEQSVNRMLMHLIMPFASYQPYVVESANVMPQEIFMGRGAELEKIESPKGVNIVYGGRQLGKSALLRMAKKDIDQDENGDRAILVDVKDKDYKQAALAVSEELYISGIFSEEEMVTDDWSILARDLKRRLRDKRLPEIPYLLLMMDEADVFIESCASVGYMPFDALKDVQSIGTDRFKFVVAGLRNIVRFNKSKALGGNSGLAHLGDLTIKPFKSIEARQLLIEPLSYLGFRFPHNRETEVLISTILSTTNYFPGMIQLYCSKLIETMQRGYAGFDETVTPPYVVGKEQIKKVLNDEKLLEAISDKFFVTLSDKDDNIYYIIALLVAYDYHLKKGKRGCTPAEVLTYAKEFAIQKLMGLHEDVMRALMEELRELNILKPTGDQRYFFTRLNFCQSLGTLNQIEDALMEFMEG